ncbi:hypothetical protein [Streptomyces sediminimaris]|uniref:hypothetical protein n=1 Tax=Streptomyces sediminimaris TaxID=3383721 RepID=UPI003999A84F
MTLLDPTAAEAVHYATDPRIRHLAEAAWRMRTGGSRTDWLKLGKNNPEALIAEAREWMRAAVAGGLLPAPSSDPAWKADAHQAADADPDTEEPRCGKCRTPFDPTDTRYDGAARYAATPYCGRCIDACHESTDAFHRCVICQ